MRSIETQDHFPLSSVKPLEGLLVYRSKCLEAVQAARRSAPARRDRSPVSGAWLEPCGAVEGLAYGRCPDNGGLFLMDLAAPAAWARLLAQANRLRHVPGVFHADLTHSRADHVYAPKLAWIQDTLRLQEMVQPRVLEVSTVPSDFSPLLHDCAVFAQAQTIDESAVRSGAPRLQAEARYDAAVLLEALDRSDDPQSLLEGTARQLVPGGLLFVTALAASGFDMTVLGLRNLYLCPPDRANCFTLDGLQALLTRGGFTLLEVSTPGVLDVEIVKAHAAHDPALALSPFERQIITSAGETQAAFQSFLQQHGVSSFARIVARKQS